MDGGGAGAAGPARRDPARLAALNPETGDHPLPADPRELAAALRAGERSWAAVPYYAARYGERGERFTRSDSAWLATLAAYPPPVALRQVRWLGGLLAARGMPRWLLERHLDVLHEELVRAVPARRGAYAGLAAAAAALRAERRAHLDDAALAALGAAFDARVGPAWSARLPETGALLGAAVADERAGVPGAVASLTAWLRDPDRFPPPWRHAVSAALRAARARARCRPPGRPAGDAGPPRRLAAGLPPGAGGRAGVPAPRRPPRRPTVRAPARPGAGARGGPASPGRRRATAASRGPRPLPHCARAGRRPAGGPAPRRAGRR